MHRHTFPLLNILLVASVLLAACATPTMTEVAPSQTPIKPTATSQPAYSRYYLHLGEISSYPPGYKENAGIFCHTNPWIMIAEDT
jgi:hypothetical protein